MKHNWKVTGILVAMFFVAQVIGIIVAQAYLPTITIDPDTGEEIKEYSLPYGLDPPQEVTPAQSAVSIVVAMIIAVVLMFLLMYFKAETFLRLWFLVVVILGIAIAVNAFIGNGPNAWIFALIIAAPLGYIKIFKRNFIVHNVTELLIYPGIASVFIPLLNVWTVVFLLVVISIYDMYAVWHAGFMQKMAKYQIEQLKIFSGFFVPYTHKGGKGTIAKPKKVAKKKKAPKAENVSVAILGGGDVVFPMLLAGVILAAFGFWHAIIIALGATAALTGLFMMSQKGKFYPAMPFISTGCLLALGIVYLIG